MTGVLLSIAAAACIFIWAGLITGHFLYPPRWKRTR